jgi:hypothetical protein
LPGKKPRHTFGAINCKTGIFKKSDDMSAVKNTYPSTYSITPRYLRVEKDAETFIVIVDDINAGFTVEVHTEIDRQVTWLRVVPGFQAVLLDEAPEDITMIDAAYEDWDETVIFIDSSEVFVVKYTSSAKTEQAEVVGYEFGSEETIYIKIDRNANTVTLYEPA